MESYTLLATMSSQGITEETSRRSVMLRRKHRGTSFTSLSQRTAYEVSRARATLTD